MTLLGEGILKICHWKTNSNRRVKGNSLNKEQTIKEGIFEYQVWRKTNRENNNVSK